jgi:hypothetical protein
MAHDKEQAAAGLGTGEDAKPAWPIDISLQRRRIFSSTSPTL